MHVGFERAWKKERTDEEKANDVAIYGWDAAPKPGDLKRIRDDKAKGRMIIGFGIKADPAFAEVAAACDAWIDAGEDSTALANGKRSGKTLHFTNAVNGWVFTGEFVAALTRKGKMPTMWKGWATEGGRVWSEKYFQKVQFHDEFTVPPIPPGELGRRYVARIRAHVGQMRNTDLADIRTMAATIDDELRAGRKTIVASAGHMVMNYIARFDDSAWAVNHELHDNVPSQMTDYEKKTPDSALVLRLDAYGLHRTVHDLFQRKKQRVLLLTGESPDPNFAVPATYQPRVDLAFAHGDACVWIEGYPIPILPPSGVMQVAAYEAINVEVLARR